MKISLEHALTFAGLAGLQFLIIRQMGKSGGDQEECVRPSDLRSNTETVRQVVLRTVRDQMEECNQRESDKDIIKDLEDKITSLSDKLYIKLENTGRYFKSDLISESAKCIDDLVKLERELIKKDREQEKS